jgi:hypothetical protein
MSVMTQGSGSDRYAAIMQRLRADHEWLAGQGIRLSQWGPDPDSGKVRVYLEHYSDGARQVLIQRYGPDIEVDTESRLWSSGWRNGRSDEGQLPPPTD